VTGPAGSLVAASDEKAFAPTWLVWATFWAFLLVSSFKIVQG
jgi:hypothetical protein